MKNKSLALALPMLALAACGEAEADPVTLVNDLPVEAMVVTEEERAAKVEAEVAVSAERDEVDATS
ncbi:hypothetical protein [Sphingomicrobium aestuariivivum]|uniref:hypothetical protein n=1 Tax=Sphingomicrobium aestuariivivum TaxID=1582356 RepID=UPI001FD6435F|nr:hypothetical protein [Sphingomicrobium aestuariivivum]MCJ8190693.1 hypothetical protein [Sphingomicrobium aestuariivivum]